MWIDSRCARARDGGVAAKKKSSPLTRRLEAFPRCRRRRRGEKLSSGEGDPSLLRTGGRRNLTGYATSQRRRWFLHTFGSLPAVQAPEAQKSNHSTWSEADFFTASKASRGAAP